MATPDLGRSFMGSSSGRRMTPQSPNEALHPDALPPPPPKPPRKRSTRLSILSGFLSFLVLAAFGALAFVGYGTSRVNEPGPLQADKVVYIPQRTDVPDLIDKLEKEGVIDSPTTMSALLLIERKRSKVKYGEYLFKAHASLQSVIDTLVSGKTQSYPVTIPEGLTSQQVVNRLKANDLLTGEVRVPPEEGSLLPETYKVTRGMSRADVLNLMSSADRRAVEQIWARRSPDLPLSSPYELVILASIVEKETGKADERPHVASVFLNRLKRHMRLDSDPTIVYGLVQGQGTLGRPITRSDLTKRTAYNTYQIDRLPPGPITNPGRAALEAVANPARTEDLYFVADGTGGHVFAPTIQDHNRNVARWRQLERDAKDKPGDVDKLAPGAGPPMTRGKERSDASDTAIYGMLSPSIVSVSAGRIAAFADPKANHDITKVAAAEARGPVASRRRGRKAAPSLDMNAMTSSLDKLGFSVEGARPASAAELLDGPPSPDPSAPNQNPPAVSAGTPAPALAYAAPTPPPAVPAAPKARAARSDIDVKPGEQHADLFADPNPTGAPIAPMRRPPAHPKIYDASEGTKIDPLKNKSYDLNSGKTIPDEFVLKN